MFSYASLSGVLDVASLKLVLEALGEHKSDEDVAEIISEHGQGGGGDEAGGMSLKCFEQWMDQASWGVFWDG